MFAGLIANHDRVHNPSHTLGGCRRCRCYSVVRYTIVDRSHRIAARAKVLFRKKIMDLCVFVREEHEDGVGTGTNY